jgi:tRNA(Arg) A34 adenosine deaminase TadA
MEEKVMSDSTAADLGHLRAAFELARTAREHGNHPFGALLVDAEGQVILSAENTVVTERDCTGHAETNLVRAASMRFAAERLAGCTLYTSTEPCAMCAGAIHWAGVGRMVYGLSAERLYALIGPSPDHLRLACREVFARAERRIAVVGPLLEEEGLAVHHGFWQ